MEPNRKRSEFARVRAAATGLSAVADAARASRSVKRINSSSQRSTIIAKNLRRHEGLMNTHRAA